MHRNPDSARTGLKPLRIALSAALLTGVIALSPISPVSPASVSAADVWTPPVDLSGPTQTTTTPQVSSDSDGRAVAVWLRSAAPDATDPALCDALDKCVVESSRFDPATQTWSATETLSTTPSENATQADVLMNGSGQAMAIWRLTSGAGSTIQAILFNGSSWAGPAVNLPSATTGSPRGPQISVGPDGKFTVVWYRTFAPPPSFVESRQFSGGTWTPALASPPSQLPLGTDENAELSRVATDTAGNVTALWQGTTAGQTFVRASRFNGTSWSAPSNVTPTGVTLVNNGDTTLDPTETLAPQLAVDPAGNATAIWQQSDGTNTRIMASRSANGSVWSGPEVLSAAGGNALNGRVESDGAGNVTALWRRFDANGYSVIQTKRFVAASGVWTTTAVNDNLSTPGPEVTGGAGRVGGQSQSHRLAVDALGNVTAVWRRNNSFNGQVNSIIQSARYDPNTNTWGAARDLSAPGQNAVSPATDIDSAGNVIVVWARTNTEGFSVIQASRSSSSVGGFVAVAPVRVFDTRPGLSDDALINVQEIKVGGTYELNVNFANLKLANNTQVTPATGLGAVSLNVTVVDPDAGGFVTLYPCDVRSEVSNVNFTVGQTVANAVIAPVAADGRICFFSNTPAHIIADINGYFPAGSGYSAVSPKRVFDTRPGESPNALLAVQKVQIGGTVELAPSMLNLGGGATTPTTGVSAVSLNVTVSNPAGSGFVTVYPCGQRPVVSSVNFVAGQTVANAVIAPLSPTGTVCFFSNIATDIIVDISGWFPSASGYAPAPTPARVFDTRPESPPALRVVPKVKIGGLVEARVPFTNLSDITPPNGVSAVALNVTVTNPIGPGFVTVYPCGQRPVVSSVNFVAGQTVANAVIAPLSASGELCFFSNLDTDLLVDINGYFAA